MKNFLCVCLPLPLPEQKNGSFFTIHLENLVGLLELKVMKSVGFTHPHQDNCLQEFLSLKLVHSQPPAIQQNNH